MFEIASLFSSKARIKVLKTLFYQTAPVALRHIALLAGLPVFSVQYALKQLATEKIIIKKRKSPYVLFELNKKHVCYEFLAGVFELETKKRNELLSDNYHQKARQVLEFASTANQFFLQVPS